MKLDYVFEPSNRDYAGNAVRLSRKLWEMAVDFARSRGSILDIGYLDKLQARDLAAILRDAANPKRKAVAPKTGRLAAVLKCCATIRPDWVQEGSALSKDDQKIIVSLAEMLERDGAMYGVVVHQALPLCEN
jgi:hypothetical protein